MEYVNSICQFKKILDRTWIEIFSIRKFWIGNGFTSNPQILIHERPYKKEKETTLLVYRYNNYNLKFIIQIISLTSSVYILFLP